MTISATDSWLNAIQSLFPGVAALEAFQRSDPEVAAIAVPRILRLAHGLGLIGEATEGELRRLLELEALPRRPLPEGFTFGNLIDRVAEGASINQLIEHELRPLCQQLGLTEVQPSMISRLRRRFSTSTRGQRNLLRVLACWIGLRRPAWGWDYATLIRLEPVRDQPTELDAEEGVRLAFQVPGPAGPREVAALDWLRGALLRAIQELGMYHLGPERVVAVASTIYLTLPRRGRGEVDVGLFALALREAVAIVHQVLVCWSLSEVSEGRPLAVGIAAGPFTALETPLQAMVRCRLPQDEPIRVTSQVRTGANLAEIKLVFRSEPREVGLVAGETMEFWVADSLWSHIYYDVVPAVSDLLPREAEALEAFRASLGAGDVSGNRALAIALSRPNETILLLEIAKACLARGLFHEADRFVAIILANRPRQVVARTLRLVIRLNLALVQLDPSATWRAFRDALDQGRYLLDECVVDNEEPPCELGQVHFCLARRIFRLLAAGQLDDLRRTLPEIPLAPADSRPSDAAETRAVIRTLILAHLGRARELFERGMTSSPSGQGNRSLHWMFRVEALETLFRRDPEAFTPSGGPGSLVHDRFDVFRGVARRIAHGLGWTTELPAGNDGYSAAAQLDLLLHVQAAFERYDNAVLSAPYRANVRYAFATLMFDFVPVLTVGVLRLVLGWMHEAETQAAAIAASTTGARSVITCFSQIQPAVLLVEGAGKARRLLLERYAAELEGPDDRALEAGRAHKFLLSSFTQGADLTNPDLC